MPPQDPTSAMGLAVAIAELRVEVKNLTEHVKDLKGEVSELRHTTRNLEDQAQRRKGITLFSQGGAILVGAAASIAAIIGLLISHM